MTLLALLLPLARAEGTDEFGVTQTLDPATRIYIDILDYTTETVTWQGDYDLEIKDPSGAAYATVSPGATFAVTSNGAWIADPTDVETDWDITVNGADPDLGRIWSYAWYVDAGSFDESDAFNSSFYAVVEGGGAGYDGVVEMKTDGFAGYIYTIMANSEGVRGANGRSVPEDSGLLSYYEYPTYLNPPEDASYTWLDPEVSAVTWSAGATGCDEVAYGYVDGEFNFTATVDGTYHIVCDLNGDGEFDITSDDDLQLLGTSSAGSNTITWDGTDNTGAPVDPGTYTCEILLTVGEFHYVATDVETSYEGFRLFSVDASANRDGLLMFWNDAEVQGDETAKMANNEWSLETSGADGVDSGDYTDPVDPNGNARSWGIFGAYSKGNNNYLDTYTWIAADTSSTFSITVADWTEDSDRDGLVDAEEDCTYATDPNDADTDDDGLGDYAEAKTLPTDPLDADSDDDGVVDGDECGSAAGCADTDGDGLVDPVDTDDDGDGVATTAENVDGDNDPTNDDTDGDRTPDYLDADDDGDGLDTLAEDENGNGVYTDDDADGDLVPDYLDPDDDGDGVATADEDVNGDGDVTDDDSDFDGTPDYLDPDDDGDGIATADEDTDADGDPTNDDADGDGVANYLDPDSDNDGIDDSLEGAADTDGDGRGDFVDTDADGDSLLDGDEGTTDSDSDGHADFQDADDDGDGIATIEEIGDGVVDSDGDGDDDHLDGDDDGDGISTSSEGGFDVDTDGDGVSDHLDDDSDGDGLLDETETNRDTDGDGTGDWRDLDSDGDGVGDGQEGQADTDGDGFGDWIDPDDDGDTVPTADETGVDTDGDGLDDRLDPDDDGDGIPTADENDEAWEDDVDGDGTNNWRDLDSDGDALTDADEGEDDFDGDGVPDYLDPDGAYEVYYKGGACGCDTNAGAAAGALPALMALIAVRRRRS